MCGNALYIERVSRTGLWYQRHLVPAVHRVIWYKRYMVPAAHRVTWYQRHIREPGISVTQRHLVGTSVTQGYLVPAAHRATWYQCHTGVPSTSGKKGSLVPVSHRGTWYQRYTGVLVANRQVHRDGNTTKLKPAYQYAGLSASN